MTNEDKLRIYAAYLPYDLKLQHMYEKAKHKGETVLRSWVKPLEPLDLSCLFPHRKDSFDWKPILYDLSYLTRDEFNFIWENETDIESIEQAISLDTESFLSCKFSYSFWTELFKNHFNVFQLPESEYINKANLTNK